MQEMERPDGSIQRELFTGSQVQNGGADRRRKMMEDFGYKFVSLKPVKYQPHQGKREIERRLRQMQRAAAATGRHVETVR